MGREAPTDERSHWARLNGKCLFPFLLSSPGGCVSCHSWQLEQRGQRWPLRFRACEATKCNAFF